MVFDALAIHRDHGHVHERDHGSDTDEQHVGRQNTYALTERQSVIEDAVLSTSGGGANAVCRSLAAAGATSAEAARLLTDSARFHEPTV